MSTGKQCSERPGLGQRWGSAQGLALRFTVHVSFDTSSAVLNGGMAAAGLCTHACTPRAAIEERCASLLRLLVSCSFPCARMPVPQCSHCQAALLGTGPWPPTAVCSTSAEAAPSLATQQAPAETPVHPPLQCEGHL